MQIELGTLLRVPRGTANTTPLEFDLKNVFGLEKRKDEARYVNSGTAPELMAVFNDGYCEVKKMMNLVNYEYILAKNAADKRKAIVALDVAPQILKDKGLIRTGAPAGSEDLRKAVLDLDNEHSALMEKVAALEAAYEYLAIKAKGFEMAYHAVKKTYDSVRSGLGDSSHALSINTSEIDHLNIESGIIGKPRY